MTRPAPAAARPLPRVAGVAGLLLAAAVAAHAAAGGALPSVGALFVPAALSVLVALVLVAAPPRRLTALGVVSVSQYVVHGLLTVSATRSGAMPPNPLPPGAGGSCPDGHGHVGAACVAPAGGGEAWASGTAMLLAHAAATVATALALTQADRVLAALLAALRPGWQRADLRLHPAGRPPRGAPVDVAVGATPTLWWVGAQPRRGPPRGGQVVPAHA